MPGFVSPESPQMELSHRPLPTSQLRETAGRVKYIRAALGTCCTEKIEPKALGVWAQARSCITKVHHFHIRLHIFPHKKIRL